VIRILLRYFDPGKSIPDQGYQKVIRMVLNALSTGYAVPRTDFKAAVHSVFESAINLRSSRGNELLTLVSSSGPDLPQGVRLGSPDDFSFEKFSLGENITYHDEQPRIGSLTVELRGA
jgi:hypothetical protein